MIEGDQVRITYYSDVLCVWAWISQPRLEQLEKQWRGRLSIRHRFIDIFGNSLEKIPRTWGEQEGFEKFGAHVVSAAADYELATVNPAIWRSVRPCSSMQAHLLLRAVAIVAGEEVMAEMALRIRRAFFCDAQDIAEMGVLDSLLRELNLDVSQVHDMLRNGRAMAQLSGDLRAAHEQGVRGSPTWVLNDGRQILYGNVGYRILNANLEELLKHPQGESSWC
jgi:predicted DsbA family dithiol-disulfide isomerase